MTRKGKVFKEKKLKNSIEIKSEKGSITVFVLSIMLFLITVVVMSYMGISSRMSEQGKQVEKIQAEYNGNTEKMNSIYKELHDESKLYVIYDSNGGEGGPEVQQKTYGETLKLSSETPKRVGYHCTGWSINKDKNSVDYEPGANYEKNATIKLYAVWEANEYTIQYDGNGATSGSTESSIHIYDEDKTLTKNNFVRKGYTFKGWSTKKNGSVEYTDEQEVINLSEEHGAKVILYAVWQKNSYTVTYNYTENGGTSATKTSDEINYGSAIDLTPTATKSGYTFVGWNTNKDGTSKLSSLTMGTSNVTLYAIYSKTITATCYYAVGANVGTFKQVSGTMYNKSTSVSINLGTTSLAGYTFRGWSTSNSGNATISVAENGNVNLSSNATYYACYSYKVTILYKYYNGSNYSTLYKTATAYMNSRGNKTGEKLTPPTVSNPSGWSPRGWSTSPNADGSVLIPDIAISNKTYYYSWSKTIKLTYNTNGASGTIDSQTVTSYLNYAGTQTSPAITISSTKLTKDGETFLKWSTDSSGKTGEYFPGNSYEFSNSTTLYAVFGKILFNANGGTVVRPKDGTIDLSSTITLSGTTANLEYAWSTNNTTTPTQWTSTQSGATVTNAKCTANDYYLWVRVLSSDKSKVLMTATSDVFNVYDVKLESGPTKTEYKESEDVSYDGIKILLYNSQSSKSLEGTTYITNYAKNENNDENIRYTYTIKYNNDYSWNVTTYKDSWYGIAWSDWYYYENHNKITGEHDLVFRGKLDTYKFDDNGVMVTGWTKDSEGKWSYYCEVNDNKIPNADVCMNFDPAIKDAERGFKLKNIWGDIRVKSNGTVGTTETWYYFDENGIMSTGWTKVGDYWYYCNSSGVMQTGWQKIDGSWYYLKIFNDGTSWSGPPGTMLCNTSATIGGKTYNFNSSGVCTNP